MFSITCKLSQGNKISSDHQNNIMVKSSKDDIILDQQIKTHDNQVAIVKFLCETGEERAQSATVLHKRDINDLHIELGHQSESITCTTAKDMGIKLKGAFKPCEDCALGKAKQQGVSKKDVARSKILGERLFFDVSSPSTSTFCGKKHCLLVIDDSSNYVWSFFLKEKSNIADVMLGIIKNLKNKYIL